jgi:predicted house-cleaning noncanonical NTP pyrophosphatase (MazG superfamily)
MSDTIYNKLVRDKILDIISASGKQYTFHIAEEKELAAIVKSVL